VRRRCHLILAVDGSQDEDYTFEDLGNAVSKIRVDFGIPIDFLESPDIHGRRLPAPSSPSKHAAVARIRYSCVDPDAMDGCLIYLKPSIDGDEPADVANYAKDNDEFPHQSTSDQFFSEVQFESYRMLGSYTVERILGDRPVTSDQMLMMRFLEHQESRDSHQAHPHG
jgi:hypothetical protein